MKVTMLPNLIGLSNETLLTAPLPPPACNVGERSLRRRCPSNAANGPPSDCQANWYRSGRTISVMMVRESEGFLDCNHYEFQDFNKFSNSVSNIRNRRCYLILFKFTSDTGLTTNGIFSTVTELVSNPKARSSESEICLKKK